MKTDIVLPEVGKSSLLKEVTRAFLHTGAPSALFHNIAEGIKRNIVECESEEDKAFMQSLLSEITDMKDKWSKREDSYYATPFTSGEG
jgi:hypothetical protein